MYLVDDLGEPRVRMFSVQYEPTSAYFPTRPHDILLELERDPKGREGVFVQPFSCGGIIPMAHVSHKVETALKFGWPELSHNGYSAIIHGHYDKDRRTGDLRSGFEGLLEFPILMGILELEGMVENAERDSLYGALVVDRETKEIRSRFPRMSISSSGIGSGITGHTPSHPRRCRRFPFPVSRAESPTRQPQSSRRRPLSVS